MDKQAFKQRMQNLKSYRENNPGKGYWDWRNSLPDNLKYMAYKQTIPYFKTFR